MCGSNFYETDVRNPKQKDFRRSEQKWHWAMGDQITFSMYYQIVLKGPKNTKTA